MSGVTDCYQPAEREFRLTRQCLEVAREAGQPISILTKNALVCRDLDLLAEMARRGLAQVSLSVTTLDPELARLLEPKTSIPAARLRAIRLLADAGVPVRVMVAPVIPGLNDREIPAILQAAREAGARSARYMLLRLPLSVEPVFQDWLRRARPLGWQRIEGLIRDTHQGRLHCSDFGTRMSGTGSLAEQIGRMFEVFARKQGLDDQLPPLDCSQFRPPRSASGQRYLF
jgi:DNA repair photolyase